MINRVSRFKANVLFCTIHSKQKHISHYVVLYLCFLSRKSNYNDINAQYNAHKSNKIQLLYSVLRNKCKVIRIQYEGSNMFF